MQLGQTEFQDIQRFVFPVVRMYRESLMFIFCVSWVISYLGTISGKLQAVIDWVEFIILLAYLYYQVYETPMWRTWDRLLITPSSEAQYRRWPAVFLTNWKKCTSLTSIVVSGRVPSMHVQSNWACSFGHFPVAQEVQCWTLQLVGGVATKGQNCPDGRIRPCFAVLYFNVLKVKYNIEIH